MTSWQNTWVKLFLFLHTFIGNNNSENCKIIYEIVILDFEISNCVSSLIIIN